MAIGWLSVLKMVPWGDVISNAPKLAEGAKKLWSAVARKRPAAELPSAKSSASPKAQSMAGLQAQLVALEAEVVDLHNQMLESAELIKALADQNTQLIKRLEVNRVRVLWLAAVVAVLCIAVASLVIGA